MGGKITLGLACLWVATNSLVLAMASGWIALSHGTLGVLWCIDIVLAFPLGFLSTGLDSMDRSMSSAELLRYCLLMVPNLFLQGYLLAGMWGLFRRLTGPLRRDFT